MQRRFTERRVNANVELCFVIGQCHGNSALFDVGVGATCVSNVVHKVPNVSSKTRLCKLSRQPVCQLGHENHLAMVPAAQQPHLSPKLTT